MLPRKEKKKKEKETNTVLDNRLPFRDRMKSKNNMTKLKSEMLRNKEISLDDPDDPYAFPDPVKDTPVVNNQTISSLTLNESLNSPVLQSKPTQCGTSSIARLYPELAEKLEKIRPKIEPRVVKEKGRIRSSRTMNKLQTKIAQNKIKDKLRKSQESGSNASVSPASMPSPDQRDVSPGVMQPSPLLEGMSPQASGLASHASALQSHGTVVQNQGSLQSQGTVLQGQGTVSHIHGTLHNQGTVVHSHGTPLSQGTVVHNQGTVVHSQGPVVHSQGTVVHGQGTVVHGQGTVIHGQGTLHSHGTVVHSQGTLTHSQATLQSQGSGGVTNTSSVPAILNQRPVVPSSALNLVLDGAASQKNVKNITGFQQTFNHSSISQRLLSPHILPPPYPGSTLPSSQPPLPSVPAPTTTISTLVSAPAVTTPVSAPVKKVSTSPMNPPPPLSAATPPQPVVEPPLSRLPPPPPYVAPQTALPVSAVSPKITVLLTRPQRLKNIFSAKDARTCLKTESAVNYYSFYAKRKLQNRYFINHGKILYFCLPFLHVD